ncbi:BlaI/MecI/CopY family transcriptional regulator [Neolewinella aurantiaca]|uniref:BlaI/MecI/CopY family transcriptional regulator n=1 Tax=Neolewinella aurantiaca TaxID=2602767 RepID=A0A5C7FV71_9BACT|nr:BlaI/MecI/CopY family transcriptional regulator [Neolewinella aurantiaca]TXF90549.1 BlaI/MecI/CopY family transcriptional regulator [Neolewinella aurantiaca]
MQKLAKREAQIMQALWELERAFVKDIVEMMPEPRPHYNSVSTMVKLLKQKGFVDFEKQGNAYQFFPVVSKEEYQSKVVGDVVKGFFDGSPMKLVNYFAKEKKLDEAELERLLKMIKDQKK